MATGFTPQQRADALARNSGICEICGEARSTDVHHRQPRGMGGAHGARAGFVNRLSNALALCHTCHDMVERDRTAATRNGWLVRRGEDPAQVPAMLNTWLGMCPTWLDDDACYSMNPPEGITP